MPIDEDKLSASLQAVLTAINAVADEGDILECLLAVLLWRPAYAELNNLMCIYEEKYLQPVFIAQEAAKAADASKA